MKVNLELKDMIQRFVVFLYLPASNTPLEPTLRVDYGLRIGWYSGYRRESLMAFTGLL